jgi:hypothetical protein
MKTITKQKPRRPQRSQRLVSVGRAIKSKTQSGDAPPHPDLLKQFFGTLQVPIVEGDLATLNTGLTFLFALLRRARRQYDEEADGGRHAAFTALGAMWPFVALFNSTQAESLLPPVIKLMEALAALDQNNVMPILKPVARRGRAPASHGYASLQGHVAGTVIRLRNSGLPPNKAHKLVAEELTRLGARSGRGKGVITAHTVRHWCDDVASDVGRLGAAAMMYDLMFKDEENRKFQALPLAKAKRMAITSLQRYVYEIFPELRAPTKNPARPPI